MQIIERIVSRVGRRVDESSPMVDARLADGSRVNAIIPPLALDGACLSIRRFGRDPVTARNMIENHTLTEAHARTALRHGEGTFESADLRRHRRRQNHAAQRALRIHSQRRSASSPSKTPPNFSSSRNTSSASKPAPPNIEGKGAVRQRQLVINSLRMRPDRIVVGEVRGEEAFDMLQAMNTGHEGSLTTVHANSLRDALARVENMVSMANLNIPERAVRHQIASAIHAVVQVARLSDGTRKVISISEVTGMDDESITMQDIFVFERRAIDENGKVRGAFRATGVRPQFADRLATFGRSNASSVIRIENRSLRLICRPEQAFAETVEMPSLAYASADCTSRLYRGCPRRLRRWSP